MRVVLLIIPLAACVPRAIDLPTPSDDINLQGLDSNNAFDLTSTLTPPLAFDLAQAETKQFYVAVDRNSSFSDLEIQMSLVGCPTGVSAVGLIVAGQLEGYIQVEADATAPVGVYECTLRLAGGDTERDVPIVLTIVPLGTKLGLSFDTPPSDVAFDQDSNGSVMVDFSRLSTATGDVSLSVEGLPPGITASLAPPTTAGTATLLTLTDTGTAVPGDTVITVRAVLPGFSDATTTFTLTIAPRQVLNITVMQNTAPFAGATVIVDGEQAPLTDGSGRTTLSRAVARDAAYTVAVMGTLGGTTKFWTLYDGLTRRDPILMSVGVGGSGGATDTMTILATTRNADGSLFWVGPGVPQQALARTMIAFMGMSATSGTGTVLGTKSSYPQEYYGSKVLDGNPWPDEYRAPFGDAGPVSGDPYEIIWGSLSLPDTTTNFRMDLSALTIEYQDRDGLAATPSTYVDTRRGWKPKTYLAFGRCSLLTIPDTTKDIALDNDPSPDDLSAICEGRNLPDPANDGLNDGIAMASVGVQQQTVTPNVTVPVLFGVDEKRLVLKSNSDGWTFEASADCYDVNYDAGMYPNGSYQFCEDDPDCPFDPNCTLPAPLSDVSYIVPSGGPAFYSDIAGYASLRARNTAGDASWVSYRVTGTPSLALPTPPAAMSPAEGATNIGVGNTFSFAPNDFAGKVMIVTLGIDFSAGLGIYVLTCYTDKTSCTVPSWLGGFAGGQMPANAPFSWRVIAQNSVATLHELTSAIHQSIFLGAYDDVDTSTESAVYRGESGVRNFTTPP